MVTAHEHRDAGSHTRPERYCAPVPSDVELLIVSYNSAGAIAECLASLQRLRLDLPVAIREHGTDPAAFALLQSTITEHPSRVRVESDPTNPGFAAGCNALARTSTAEWLVFLNPDTMVLAWPWQGGREPPRAEIVGPAMVDAAGDHSGVSYTFSDEVARSWLRRRGERPQGLGFVSGAALLLDAVSFGRLGGFDESYFMYYEDIDLCLRANAAGIPTHIAEEWRVHHSRAHSTRERFGESLVWSYDSACRFRSTHGTPLPVYRAYVLADALIRSTAHAVRRDRPARDGYVSLARRAWNDLIHRRGVPAPPRTTSV